MGNGVGFIVAIFIFSPFMHCTLLCSPVILSSSGFLRNKWQEWGSCVFFLLPLASLKLTLPGIRVIRSISSEEGGRWRRRRRNNAHRTLEHGIVSYSNWFITLCTTARALALLTQPPPALGMPKILPHRILLISLALPLGLTINTSSSLLNCALASYFNVIWISFLYHSLLRNAMELLLLLFLFYCCPVQLLCAVAVSPLLVRIKGNLLRDLSVCLSVGNIHEFEFQFDNNSLSL